VAVVRDIKPNTSLQSLVDQMKRAGGFGAPEFASAADILAQMWREKNCLRFLSFPANIVSTGTRGVLADMVRRKLFDFIITTGGTFDHDLARAWGGKYYEGRFEADDAALRRRKVNRLGNVFVPDSSYGILLEKKMQTVLEDLSENKTTWTPSELAAEFGSRLKDKNSILYWAAKNGVKVYSPGILDGAFGTQLTFFSTRKKFQLDELADEKELARIAFKAKRTGALMIGGGISKHHTLWWNQFKGGLDYAVYITTAQERDGSLSGARLKEAVSWGKISPRGKHVTVDGDATILLPIIVAAVYGRLARSAKRL